MSAAPRVLVVDDEPGVLLSIAAILELEGYDVAAAAGTEEALAYLRAAPFDVVLTDLTMEGPTGRDGAAGLSLVAELQRRWPQTLAIILTGYASLDSAIAAIREGAYDYLFKPCAIDELKATVARAVERSALARALSERLEEVNAANAKLQAFSTELQQRVEQATAELSQKVAELAEAKRQLEEANQQREQFISMVAHELRQPLTMISGYAQLLERQSLPADVQERARATLVAETRRLGRLVQDLADASQLAAGQFQLYIGEYDLAQIVREQVELARANTERHTIRLDVPPESVPAMGDQDRLAQMLLNLLGNAVKYSPGGPIKVRVAVEQQQALVTVSDHGPGIPPDRLEAIFQPHVRLDGQETGSRPKGTGLGLYIARGIVESHGGRIWAESVPGQGTTFKICLPLTPVAATAPLEAQQGVHEER